MKTKTLLLSAVAGALGLASASAQVYSVNAVGYVNATYSPGFSLISNPLDATDNTIGSLFPAGTLPNFSQIFKWNGAGFDIYTLTPGGWDDPSVTLEPGDGAFVNVASETAVTFVGEVPQGDLQTAIPAGFSIVSSQVPQAGTFTELGLDSALANFDQALVWNGSGYNIHTLTFGAWDPVSPTIEVGESFFVNASSATSWDRTFSVNQ